MPRSKLSLHQADLRTPDEYVKMRSQKVFLSWHLPVLAALLSGVLLALPYNYAGLYFTTWFAFVPLLLAVRGRGLAGAYGLGLVAGLAMYLSATSWMVEFLQRLKDYPFGPAFAGAVLFWLLTAQLPAFLMLTFRCLQRRVGDRALWFFPPLLMLFYGWFPVLFPLQLGESQSAFLPAIQAASLTGVYGLDFVLGVSNILLAAAVITCRGGSAAHSGPSMRGTRTAGIAGLLVVGGWLGYGCWALDHWDRKVAEWPTLAAGLVQPNEIPSAAVPPPAPGYARGWPPEMELSQPLAEAGAEVILWPETRYKGYFESDHIRQAFSRNVALLGVPLVFHDAEKRGNGSDYREHNTAVFLGANGELEGLYRKHQLVAFGETLPLADQFPKLARWAERFLGEFFTSLTPGTERTEFPVGEVNLVPAICYESAFPGHVSRSLTQASVSPLLVVLSNNGWFGESREPWQHAGATVLRAVENRVSLIHVMNNGPSTVVTPSGRIIAATEFGQPAAMLAQVPYTPAGERFSSWFTRWPEWFPVTSGLAFLLLLIGPGMRQASVPTAQSVSGL